MCKKCEALAKGLGITLPTPEEKAAVKEIGTKASAEVDAIVDQAVTDTRKVTPEQHHALARISGSGVLAKSLANNIFHLIKDSAQDPSEMLATLNAEMSLTLKSVIGEVAGRVRDELGVDLNDVAKSEMSGRTAELIDALKRRGNGGEPSGGMTH